MAKEKEAVAEGEAPAKPSLVSRIIPILIISILAGGGGFLQGSMIRGGSAPAAAAPEAAKTAEEQVKPEGGEAKVAGEEAPVEATTIVRPLAPVISNLGNPSETWMRLEVSLLLSAEAAKEQDILAAKAGESVVTFLRTVDLKKIEGPSGFLHFREDLSNLLTTQFHGMIAGVLIGSMVVE
jgi:flagellar protein FliL